MNLKLTPLALALLFLTAALAFSAPAATTAPATEPSTWTPRLAGQSELAGRRMETFTHGVKAEWGYAGPQTDTFIVLHPAEPQAKVPLYVVLHSAGHDVRSCVACTKQVGNHDIYRSPPGFLALYLDCRANKGDWWWGSESHKGPEVGPTERRVVDTVLWTIAHYDVDPDRVYLCGNSMGGSGALGIGMRRGDLFAAIKANVPAKVEHVSSRMYFPPASVPDSVHLPDPPVVVDYSAQNDTWSKGHESFARAMDERRYALYLYWGPFGHANNSEAIKKVNDLIDSFDWLQVRRDRAYPAFTAASTNDALPWPAVPGDKRVGQVNAFFPLDQRERHAGRAGTLSFF